MMMTQMDQMVQFIFIYCTNEPNMMQNEPIINGIRTEELPIRCCFIGTKTIY